MSRATVSGLSLRILVEQAEATRKKVEEINKQCDVSSYNSILGFDSDMNQRRDWYLALVERGAENIMLENEDYLEYFYLVSFDVESFEKCSREQYEFKQQHQKALEEHYNVDYKDAQLREEHRVNCPVLEEELQIREEVLRRPPKPTLWQKIKDAFTPIPGSGPGPAS